ncbi:MAG TPA: NPCBM/NEW2 domain-containing protein, partial [Verrucomicrobiota bacterium]|nr:NPCBM/NEW2 domain-containing protein [Verrucomicrobiota bacterium]
MSSYGQDFKKLAALAVAILAGLAAGSALAVTVAPVDLAQTRVWASAKLEGKPLPMPKTEGLVVYANHDPVQKRGRNGKPMNISGTLYTRGLYCHAQSHVLVRLPAAGKKFKTEIGVDSNSDTSGGRGSVKFIVRAGDKELYRSDEMNEGQGPISLSLDLDGKDELVLLVDSCGEISCDQ